MLKQDDILKFMEAILVEIEAHNSRNHWIPVPRSSLAPGIKTIILIWYFKCKCIPNGRISKYKARLCAHGGMQRGGIDYWETYSPVVYWISVRLLFSLTQILKLESRSINFVLDFPHAELDEDIYMEAPYGFDFEGARTNVLKLNKSIYELK